MTRPCLSQNNKRNKSYTSFLKSQAKTVKELIQLGSRLMRKERLHPHFFGNNTLLETAQFLTFYSLGLPHDYKNKQYLNRQLTAEETLKIFSLFERRISERIPVEYLTHEASYLGYSFYVNEQVLVPRSLMNTRFKDFLSGMSWETHRVLDLCTGSGCIGISLALLNPKLRVDLVDLSPQALAVAAINIKKHALESRVSCIQSDLFEKVSSKYDLIITNPPYVSSSEYQKGPLEFKNEPRMALESGSDGLTLINKILLQAKNYLNPQGKIIAEVGFTAAKRLKRNYPKLPFKWFTYRKPSGKQAFLAMDCIFECQAEILLPALLEQNLKTKNIFLRFLDFLF